MKNSLKISIAIIAFCLFSTNLFAQFPKDPGTDPFDSQQKENDITPTSTAPESNAYLDLNEADSLNSERIHNAGLNSEIKNRKTKNRKTKLTKTYKLAVSVSPKNFAVKETK